MKKTLVTALTTALVVGAASTTFAAANPFSDVPADHWAYDAVTQLAADGIVTGFPDGTFKGDQDMTRYEMAQIVAKALAHRTTAPATDKAMIDKLAAEFSDELTNLGVRVAALEKKVDNVKFDGYLRYEYTNSKAENSERTNMNRLNLRLNMHAQVNNKWQAHGRMETFVDANSGMNSVAGDSNSSFKVTTAYADATYGTTYIKLGRFDSWDNATRGMLMDDQFTGAEVKFTSKSGVEAQLGAGRINRGYGDDKYVLVNPASKYTTATYLAAEVYKKGSKWDVGAGYREYRGEDFAAAYGYKGNKAAMWNAGATYKLGKAYLAASYAKATDVEDGDRDNSQRYELGYAPSNKYAFRVAYMNLALANMQAPTYEVRESNDQKGWEVAMDWYMQKNVMLKLNYFDGKVGYHDLWIKDKKFFTRLEFAF